MRRSDRRQGYAHGESGLSVLEYDRAAMALDDRLGHREAKAAAGRRIALEPVKALENSLAFVRRNSRPGVVHRKRDTLAALADRSGDGAAPRRIARRVVDQGAA